MIGLEFFPFLIVMSVSMVGSIIGASIGFGFAIILVAFFQFFMEPVDLVCIIIILTVALTLMRVIETWRIRHWRRSLRLIIPGLLGVPIGVAILKYLDPVLMKRSLNLALLMCMLMIAYGRYSHHSLHVHGRKGELIEVLAGFVGGILGGSCSLSGPPVVLLGVLQGWKKMEMHAVWARFFLSNTLFSFLTLSINGLYNRSTILISFFSIPAVYLGFIIGTWIRNMIVEERFSLYVFFFLVLSGIAGFVATFI